MPTASCMCGGFALEYTGEPQMKAACNCLPCRKTSGALRSLNVIVPMDSIKITKGTPTKYTRTGDSGKGVTYSFCPTCGGLLLVDAEALPGAAILKVGMIDEEDAINDYAPTIEMYCKRRIEWLPEYDGIKKAEAGGG